MGRDSCAVPGAYRSRTECERRLALDDIAAPAGAAVHPQSGPSLAGVTARARDRRSGCAGGGVARLVTSDRNVNSQCNPVPAPACPAPPARQRRRGRIKGGRIRYGRGGRRRTAGVGIALVAPGLRVAYPPATDAARSSVRSARLRPHSVAPARVVRTRPRPPVPFVVRRRTAPVRPGVRDLPGNRGRCRILGTGARYRVAGARHTDPDRYGIRCRVARFATAHATPAAARQLRPDRRHDRGSQEPPAAVPCLAASAGGASSRSRADAGLCRPHRVAGR